MLGGVSVACRAQCRDTTPALQTPVREAAAPAVKKLTVPEETKSNTAIQDGSGL